MSRLFNVVANLLALLAGGALLVFFSPLVIVYMAYVFFVLKPVPAGGFSDGAKG